MTQTPKPDKDEKKTHGNFTKIPNMLCEGAYNQLEHDEKWLYVCVKSLCKGKGTRFLSLRYIARKTGFPLSSLSKKLPRLHEAGLVHCEFKKRLDEDGNEYGNAQYHVTIADKWEENDTFYGVTCSPDEQDEGEDSKPVHDTNEPVHHVNTSVHQTNEPVQGNERTRSRGSTSKDIEDTKDLEDNEEESTLDASASTHTHFIRNEFGEVIEVPADLAEKALASQRKVLDLPEPNLPINFEEKKKRKTDPDMQAIDLSHSHVDRGNSEELDDVPTVKLQAIPKGQADVSVDNNTLPGIPPADHTDMRDMEHAERARETEEIEALGLAKGQAHDNDSSVHSPEHRAADRVSGNCAETAEHAGLEQKPGAGTRLSPVVTPPSGGHGDATSVQAPSSIEGTQPARHSGAVPELPVSAGAAQVVPKRPRAKKPLVMPEPKPTITLTEQEQAFWDLWLGVWFNIDIPPHITETAHGHVVKLAPHITAKEQLDGLIEFTRKDLQETQGIKRKMVHLGNLVNSYPGWKQSQQPTAKTNGTKPYVIDEERNQRHIAEMRARNAEKRERLAANG
jgi:hypothetical protein